MEAPFFCKETILQMPGPRFPRVHVIPEKFVAKEDLHRGAKTSVNVVDKDDDTVCMSNLPGSPDKSNQQGPLTFDPNPPDAKEEDSNLSSANNQAELM